MNFIQYALEKELTYEQILEQVDDWIDVWHNKVDIGMSLEEHLGMDDEEYNLFIRGNKALKKIIENRKR
jgi:hypothetical protein